MIKLGYSDAMRQVLAICNEHGHEEVIAQVRRAWAVKEQIADPSLTWDQAVDKANAEPYPVLSFEERV